MKKETVYLDTSVLSAYYDERVKERQKATIRFWEEVLPSVMSRKYLYTNFHSERSEESQF